MEPFKANIEVMTYSVVSKVLLDEANNAKGIQVDRFGQKLEYFSATEVVLSAGAIGSPQGLKIFISESMSLY